MLCIKEARRVIEVLGVFLKHGIFLSAYRDIYREHISDKACSCEIDMEHRKRASKLRNAFEELGVTFIKLGQLLSRRHDILPQAYILELERLQDRVSPVDFSSIRKEIEKECICTAYEHRITGKHSPFCYHCNRIEGIFSEFDEKPIASASIAQVHKAKLKNGAVVAVKVVKPGVIDQVNIDLRILEKMQFLFSLILKIDIKEFIEELKRKLMEEFDLRNEALNMEIFRKNFKGFNHVKIPGVYWDYSRENVLVMEFIDGKPLREAEIMLDKDEKKKLAEIIAGSFYKQIYFDGFFHSDPHPGNIFVINNNTIAFLDFGGVGRIDSEMSKNLRKLFYATFKKNIDSASEAMLKIADAKNVDILSFKSDMARVIEFQHISKIREKRSDRYVYLALKYNLSLPPIFMVLARALVLLETTCLELDPEFAPMKAAKPYIKKLVFEEIKESIKDVPEMIRELISELKD